MSDETALAPRPPSELARQLETPAEVKAKLQAARDRLKTQLDTLENDLGAVGKWKDTVRKHPVLTIGGMFLAGYLLGRWWGRR